MPKGPLGFPRFTSIGPLVTDGGSNEYKMGDVAIIEDHEALGLDTDHRHALEISTVHEDEVDVRIMNQNTARSEGMATIRKETLDKSVRII